MGKYFAVKNVVPNEDHTLLLTFSNGERRIFDMKPYLNKGLFKSLKDLSLFNTAHVSFDTVEWDNELDFDPEVLYAESKKVVLKKYSSTRSSTSKAAEAKVGYRKKK